MLSDNEYKLDRNAFKKQSFEEADHTKEYWLSKSVEERLAATFYLNSVAYNFDINNPPRMDKTVFSKRKHSS